MMVSGGTGYGWCTASAAKAFTVEKWDRAVNTWTLAHEIGHNQACGHNREDDNGCAGTSAAYGYYFDGNSGIQWGTVMSYPGTRIPHYSNPNVLFDGQPTGAPRTGPGAADCVYTINTLTPWCEAFRLTRSDIWVDFSWNFPMPHSGTFDEPYDTFADGVAALAAGNEPSEPPTLHIKGGTTNETPTISKAMTVRACDGSVTIGAP